MAHRMPTTHVGCYRPAVLDGGSNPPISTNSVTARYLAGRLRWSGIRRKTRSVLADFLHYWRRHDWGIPARRGKALLHRLWSTLPH